MVFIYIIVCLTTLLLLVLATKSLVASFEHLASKGPVGKLPLAAVLVAMSTSLPELFVGLTAAFEGVPQLSLGNVVGSNIINSSLIVGLATVLAGGLAVVGDYYIWMFAVALFSGLAPLFLYFDGEISRFDGLLLIVIYLIYLRDLVVGNRRMGHSPLHIVKKTGSKQTSGKLIKFGLAVITLIVSSHYLVVSVVGLAHVLKVPILLISLLVVALGTSIPELAVEIEAIRKKKTVLALGNILGSTVANSTLIVGLTAIISPIRANGAKISSLAGVGFVVVFGLFWLLSRSKRKLTRAEGLVLVGAYLMFVGLELMVG